MKGRAGQKKEELGDAQGEYEQLVQGLEAEIRGHIRVEQQLKVYIESVQEKLDGYDALQAEVKELNKVSLCFTVEAAQVPKRS